MGEYDWGFKIMTWIAAGVFVVFLIAMFLLGGWLL